MRIFKLGEKRTYSKARDAPAILNERNLEIAAQHCPELKAFLNTLLRLSGAVELL